MAENPTRRDFLGAMAAGATVLLDAARAAEQPAGEAPAPARKSTIVDSHVHVKHGDSAHTEYSARVIVETMDAVGIDQSVVFAMSTTTWRSIEMAGSAAQQYPERLIPYVYALPNYERPVIREIDQALKEGLFRGVKIHAGEGTLAEYVLDPVLRTAVEYGVPCLIDCMGKQEAAKRIAQTFPEAKLIFAHMGRYLSPDTDLIDSFVRLAEKYRNVSLDLSGVALVEKIVEAVKQIGSARLVWGTDGPQQKPDLVTFARTELDKIRRLDLSDEDKDNILGGNIRALLAR